MKDKQLTVSEISSMIAARADTYAELQALALEAYGGWRELEAKLPALEHRVAHACDAFSEVRLRVARVHLPEHDEATGPEQ
jgi:hypothetical protein